MGAASGVRSIRKLHSSTPPPHNCHSHIFCVQILHVREERIFFIVAWRYHEPILIRGQSHAAEICEGVV